MANTAVLKRNATKKILAIDDDGEIGIVLDMILDPNEFELDYVNSILSADEYLEKHKPAVIVLDNKLPDGYGVDFINYLKKKHSSVKIIMISGFGSVRDVALSNGADAFLEKPFSLDEFNETVDRLVH